MASLWHWKPVWLGLLRAAAIVATGIVSTSILVWRLSGPVYFLSPWVLFLLGLAAVAGGYRAARVAGRRGWLQGLIVGALLALFCMGFWSSAGTYSAATAGVDAFILTTLGATGGTIGAYRMNRRRPSQAGL
ncbi:TIGR04086 family membrane protein [Heliomicrobium modesticaldum]|uniref:TIGR04086 family membrane protein n=1 Tax=Heliomicrobium modesticaldum TaxID=35701 RepID=UPI0011D16F0F|nr:TIGR04086 family membrane protein [Heliomicrobium modesticaldum]